MDMMRNVEENTCNFVVSIAADDGSCMLIFDWIRIHHSKDIYLFVYIMQDIGNNNMCNFASNAGLFSLAVLKIVVNGDEY